jgi:hypothetical protein
MFLWFIVSIVTIVHGYALNIHLCDPVDVILKFEIIELRCNLDRNVFLHLTVDALNWKTFNSLLLTD